MSWLGGEVVIDAILVGAEAVGAGAFIAGEGAIVAAEAAALVGEVGAVGAELIGAQAAEAVGAVAAEAIGAVGLDAVGAVAVDAVGAAAEAVGIDAGAAAEAVGAVGEGVGEALGALEQLPGVGQYARGARAVAAVVEDIAGESEVVQGIGQSIQEGYASLNDLSVARTGATIPKNIRTAGKLYAAYEYFKDKGFLGSPNHNDVAGVTSGYESEAQTIKKEQRERAHVLHNQKITRLPGTQHPWYNRYGTAFTPYQILHQGVSDPGKHPEPVPQDKTNNDQGFAIRAAHMADSVLSGHKRDSNGRIRPFETMTIGTATAGSDMTDGAHSGSGTQPYVVPASVHVFKGLN